MAISLARKVSVLFTNCFSLILTAKCSKIRVVWYAIHTFILNLDFVLLTIHFANSGKLMGVVRLALQGI